jgi:hypothetical protein
MPKYNIDTAMKAVQFLVDTPYYSHHCRKIRSSTLKPRALPFKDELAPLNELIIIGRQSMEALELLLELAAFKRDDHNDYQRKFMAQKRKRDKRVIKIEETVLRATLNQDQRRELLVKQYDIWNREKEAYVNKEIQEYTEQFGEPPGGEQKYTFIREFWEWKDAELSMMEERAEVIAHHIDKVPRKKVVVSPSIVEKKLYEIVDRKK